VWHRLLTLWAPIVRRDPALTGRGGEANDDRRRAFEVQVSGSELSHLIATYGYLTVAAFVFIESMGIPFPGETTLIVASIYAGSTHHLNIVFVIVAAVAGAILGDNTGYAIGRYGGYRLLRRYGHYIHLNERELKLGQYLFLRHGGKVVFFGRFVSVLRAWAAFLAGVDRMPWWKFLVFNAAGGILWATIYGLGAYLLGKNINRFAGPVGIAIGVVAAVIIVGFLVYLHRNFSRLADEAEQAFPGPLDAWQRRPPEATKRSSPEAGATAAPRAEARSDAGVARQATPEPLKAQDGPAEHGEDAGSSHAGGTAP
jgi:membrane protein DedA with SNARE-associated domain